MPKPGVEKAVSSVIGTQGGSVSTAEGVRVDIPPGALASELRISISTARGEPSGALLAAEFEPTGTQFAKPVTISFPVDDDSLGSIARLKVMLASAGSWVALRDRGADAATARVTGKTTHFSVYGLVASSEVCDNAVDDDGDQLADCDDPVCRGEASCADSPDGGVTTCKNKNQCASGETCSNGVCVPVSTDGGTICHNDNQCASGEVCSNGSCISAPADAGTTCKNDKQCATGEVCSSGICVPAFTDAGMPDAGDPDAGEPDAGVPDAGTSICHNDNQCAADEVCSSNTCVPAPADAGSICHNDNQCAADEVCSNGFCAPAPADAGTTCKNDKQCATDEVCSSGLCVPAPTDGGVIDCQSDLECPSPLRCRGFRCK